MINVNIIQLVLITVCLLVLNNEAQVISQRLVQGQKHNRNLEDHVYNEYSKSGLQPRQKKYSQYGPRPIIRKRQDNSGRIIYPNSAQGEQIFNVSDYAGHPPYAIGLEEALFYRQQYFLAHGHTPISERNYDNVHVKAHKVKITDGHHIVAHHLRSKQSFGQKDDQLENENVTSYNSMHRNGTHMRNGIKDRFIQFGEKLMNYFGRNHSSENEQQPLKRSYPKHRKRSENLNENLLKQPGTYETKEDPPNIEKDKLIDNIPRIFQISLHEKSSGKYRQKGHMICEKDENTQHVQCRNTKTKVIRKEEDSVMHSNPKVIAKVEKDYYPTNDDSFTDLY